MDTSELPPGARRFLRTPEGVGAERAVDRFHRWMKAKHVTPTGLSMEEVESFFVQPFRKTVSPRTSWHYKRRLIRYLDWLYEKGQLDFDPKQLCIHRKRPLPELAVRFLRSLEPTHKRSTRNSYRSSLARFHDCLADNRIFMKRLKRTQMEQWFLALSDEGLHPSTRRHILIDTRTYLHWLLEHNELRADPDDLVRSSDLPKLPTYLPRPLSPIVDIALQERLEASPERLHQALLLMRLTGLRIGELANLRRDCLRVDLHGRTFLKVPLGKLDNERLVPIDDRIVSIVEGLQQLSDSPALERLIENTAGDRVSYHSYHKALAAACEGINSAEPITSHRLRHTYATSLLAAGVSLPSVMRLLGHRDLRMTLRYAAITQETLTKEYFEALPNLQSRYHDALHTPTRPTNLDPVKSLSDVGQWIRKHIFPDPARHRVARSLLKRLGRVQFDLEREIADLDHPKRR